MEKDDVLKLKAAVLYVVNKCGKVGFLRLFKILYFANRAHYAKYGRGVINDTFCALPKGPVPTFLYDALKSISSYRRTADYSIIVDCLYNPENEEYYVLKAKEQPDMDELSASDIECLDKSIGDYKNMDINKLSSISHDSAWEESKSDHGGMSNLSIAKAGGANEAMLEYIKEKDLIDSLLR